MTWKTEGCCVRHRDGQWEATKSINVSHYYFCSESEHANSEWLQSSEILATTAESLTYVLATTCLGDEYFYYTKWT